MEEKIKISIKQTTLDLLNKDCENFGFLKNDDSLNKNSFLNTLIVNFYEDFSNSEEDFQTSLMKVLEFSKNKEDLYSDILKIINKKEMPSSKLDKTVTLSFKPVKNSEKAIEYITNILINNESISSYYRRMFTSYSHKPQNERELIIFKENYELLNKSINKNLKVCISLKNDNVIKEASVYSLANSKEELFNYVLLEIGEGNLQTVRLAKIKNVSLLTKERAISNKAKEIFDKQIKYGVQYTIFPHETETVKIRLSEKGKYLFKKLYLYRPVVEKIENDIYHFNCSYNQIYQYFSRFGKHAIILEPKELGEKMKNYYFIANKTYQKLFPFKIKEKNKDGN